MKRFLFPLLVVASISCAALFVSGCDNKEPKKDFNKDSKPESVYTGLTAEEVAEAMANGGLALRDFVMIAKLVSDNVSEGYDERIYLEDIVSSESSLRDARDGFAQKIADRLSVQGAAASLRSSDPASNLNRMAEAKISFYWPYVSSWDMRKFPVIAFVDENTPKDQVQIEAFQIGQDGQVIDKIMVDEAYAKKNPVVIVSRKAKISEFLLKAKPTNYLSPFTGNPGKLRSEGEATPDNVKSLYLGQMRLVGHYDPWIWGGSEVCLRVAYAFPTKDPNTGKLILEPKFSVVNVNFTREEIDNKVTKTFDTMLVPELLPSMAMVHFKMVEDDTWFASETPITITLSYKGVQIGVTFKIPSRFDDIYESNYSYNFLLSRLNMKDGKPIWHRGGEAEWTLPIKE